jgi:hypothetical protein
MSLLDGCASHPATGDSLVALAALFAEQAPDCNQTCMREAISLLEAKPGPGDMRDGLCRWAHRHSAGAPRTHASFGEGFEATVKTTF